MCARGAERPGPPLLRSGAVSSTAQPPRSLTLSSPGVSLHAVERNPEGSPSLLLVHGYLDHCRGFDWLCDKLPHTFRTLALDLRGHGGSAHAEGGLYHLTDYLADVDHALDALGEGPVHLVGHSLGGTVVLLYAAARPERTASVTSIESLGPSGGDAAKVVDRMRRFLPDLRRPPRQKLYGSVEEAARRLRAGNPALGEEAALHLATWGTRPAEGGVVFRFDPAHRRTFGLSLDEAQVLALFVAVKAPVQVLYGTNGFPFDPALAAPRLGALRARPPIQLEGGHHLHLDAPAEVASLIASFVAGL